MTKFQFQIVQLLPLIGTPSDLICKCALAKNNDNNNNNTKKGNNVKKQHFVICNACYGFFFFFFFVFADVLLWVFIC